MHTETTAGSVRRPPAPFPRRGKRPSGSIISMALEPGPCAAAGARGALLALQPRLEPLVFEDVKLLVSELVTNSVRHSDMDSTEPVRLEVSLVDSGALHVEVCDSGVGFEPRPRHPGQSKAGGWGLYLVERLTDRWGVACNNLTRVWFEIDLRGARRNVAPAATAS